MPLLFSVCIYLLVKNLNRQSILVIDEEYTGKEKIIEAALKKLLGAKWEGSIRFERIGKSSPAHELAWTVHRSKLKRKEALRLNFSDVDKLLFGK